MLKKLMLFPVYDSAEYDLIRDLQVPLLQHSIDYLRGVGFFTSGWLRVASQGIVDFIQNGGKARVVLSPVLEQCDWEAMQVGNEARFNKELRFVLAKCVKELETSLETDTLNVLSWMIADRVLDIRFAVPRDLSYPGNYHDKVGVFIDKNGDSVAIHGSLNDSIQGSWNGEAFSVFKSWDDGQLPYLKKHKSRLELLWNNQNPTFRINQIPEAVVDDIVKLRSTVNRPYSIPTSSVKVTVSLGPHCPVNLHPFQETAISKWKEADCRGIFEMATGTGKTLTSLACAVNKFNEKGRLSLIILVPYLHLLEQWKRNCREFGFSPVVCSSKHGKWQINVKSCIQDFNLGTISNICILAIHMTAASERFQRAICRLKKDVTMIIGDEAHGLGSEHLRKALTEQAEIRLGLSATPRRWFDDKGTETLISYFGATCFEYTLDQAIGKYLTPYRYFPQLVSLTDDEVDNYEELTSQITSLIAKAENDTDIRERMKMLLLKRSRIISKSKEKLPALLNLLKKLIEERATCKRDKKGVIFSKR